MEQNPNRLNLELEGLTRNALEGTYEICLIKKLTLEAKLNRLKKELAVTACMIEDGKEVTPEQLRLGFLNLIAYIESNNSLPEEMDLDKTAIDLVGVHLEKIKKYEENRLKLMKGGK